MADIATCPHPGDQTVNTSHNRECCDVITCALCGATLWTTDCTDPGWGG